MVAPLNTSDSREHLVNTLRDYLLAGIDVDLVGRVGSGRSTLLHMLAEKMKSLGYAVLHLEPIPVQRSTPLAALNDAVSMLRGEDRGRFQGTDAAYLERVTASRKMVVLFDDWQAMDEASWAFIAKLRRRHELPVVSTHLPGPIPVRPEHLLPGTPGLSPASVHLPPLGLDELRSLLEKTLEGNVEHATLSRIYAQSAGLPGVALAVAKTAKIEGTLVLLNGVWTARQDLWSYAFAGIARRQMFGLDKDQMDALAQLSVANLMDVHSALELVPAQVLEELEAREFVRTVKQGSRRWISVNPPLLTEYFRHEGGRVRSARIEEQLNETLIHASAHTSELVGGSRPTPQFIGLSLEKLDEDLEASARAWNEERSVGSALLHLEALNASHAPRQHIDQVLKAALQLRGTAEQCARLRVWSARWRANADASLQRALPMLEDRDGLGHYARLLDAAASHLHLYFGSVDSALLDTLEDDPQLPLSVRQELARQRATVLLVQARFDEAWDALEGVNLWAEDTHPHLLPALRALILFGKGRFSEALGLVNADFARARDEISQRSLQSSGNVLALLMLISGRHSPLQGLGETVLDAGPDPYFPLTPSLGVLCCVACSSHNEPSGTQDMLQRAAGLSVPNGPFPGTSRSWPQARLAAINTSAEAGAQILWDSAGRSMQRGRVFSACMDALISLELHYDPQRMNQVEGWLAVLHSPMLRSVADHLRAVQDQDGEAVLASARHLAGSGWTSRSLNAYQQAAQIFSAQGLEHKAEQALTQKQAFELSLEPGSIDALSFFNASPIQLTARERDVVQLVAAGLSNQQIATRLILSVRTVENHIHRAMRKTGAASRTELAQFLPRP